MEKKDIIRLIQELDSYVEEYSHEYTTASMKESNFRLEHKESEYTEEDKIKYHQLESAVDYYRDKLEFLGQVKEVLESLINKE